MKRDWVMDTEGLLEVRCSTDVFVRLIIVNNFENELMTFKFMPDAQFCKLFNSYKVKG